MNRGALTHSQARCRGVVAGSRALTTTVSSRTPRVRCCVITLGQRAFCHAPPVCVQPVLLPGRVRCGCLPKLGLHSPDVVHVRCKLLFSLWTYSESR